MLIRGNKFKLAVATFAVAGLAACGGGSGGSAGGSAAGSNGAAKTGEVAGPLDALQQPLSNDVIGALAGATAGTPLEPVLSCVDQAVVNDLLDVADSVALAAEEAAASGDPAAAFQDAAASIQGAATGFATNTANLLMSLAGGAGCSGDDTVDGGDGFATGTPLDAIIAPLLDAISGGGAGGLPGLPGLPAGGDGDDVDLTDVGTFVSNLVDQFNNGYAQFLQQVPAEATTAPVVGGVLALLSDAVNDLDSVVTAVTAYQPEASSDAAEALLNNALNNVLLGVLPVTAIEDAAGQSGIVSGQVSAGIDQVTGAIGSGLDALFDPLLAQGLDGAAAPLLDPIENQVIHLIFGQINDAIGGGSDGGTGSPLPSTPLDAILGPLTDALGSGGLPSLPGVPSAGGTGTPLDIILNPLLGAVAGGSGASSDGGSPLDSLTGLLSPVLNALNPVLAPVLGAPAGSLLPTLNTLVEQLSSQLNSGPLSPATAPLSALLLTLVDSINDIGLDDAAMDTVINPALEQLLGLVGQVPVP